MHTASVQGWVYRRHLVLLRYSHSVGSNGLLRDCLLTRVPCCSLRSWVGHHGLATIAHARLHPSAGRLQRKLLLLHHPTHALLCTWWLSEPRALLNCRWVRCSLCSAWLLHISHLTGVLRSVPSSIFRGRLCRDATLHKPPSLSCVRRALRWPLLPPCVTGHGLDTWLHGALLTKL